MEKLKRKAGPSVASLIEHIDIENGSLDRIGPFLKRRGVKRCLVVLDEQTYRAAGQRVLQRLSSENIEVETCSLKANEHGDVVADEATLIQLIVQLDADVDVLLAVGAGTIHDIVRFAGCKCHIPFVSVPTAASVDGFTSAGAPLILRGVKKTVQTSPPIAVFADLSVLKKAPENMTAAGFGDMLGKYTSLVDWYFSHLLNEEPYDAEIADITREALEKCVQQIDEIGAATEKGLRVLTTSLVESGLAMLIVNHSRPASGAEHHLSHYWEMEHLHTDRPQLLHGAKVGAAATIIASLYRSLSELEVNQNGARFRGVECSARLSPERWSKLVEHWSVLQPLLRSIPSPDRLQQYLQRAGGATTPEALGVERSLLQRSLQHAHTLRDRYTGLAFIHDMRLLGEIFTDMQS